MSIKNRLAALEGRSKERRGFEPSAVFLCELQTKGSETEDSREPKVAYIMKGPNAGCQLSRGEEESRKEFETRVERVVEGIE